jgi:hypothetical protein
VDDQQNLSQLATVITPPEVHRLAPIYRKEVALPAAAAFVTFKLDQTAHGFG